MMLPADPAVRALLLFLNVAPIALYFLFLGLVNSHARPCRVSSRADFVALTSVIVPILFWPVPALVVSGLWWLLAVEIAAATWGFLHLLPRRQGGWVIYNISEGRWRSAWESAARRAGLRGGWDGTTWRDERGDVSIHYSSLGPLRNVSVELMTRRPDEPLTDEVARLLDRQFARMEQLPSATGACLWVLGISLMILPLWIVGRHLPDVASAVARLFG